MKLLMYGVNKETVMKEDVDKYLLTEADKRIQMFDISKITGVDEIVVLTDNFRNEYYLYVDEEIFSHGEFLRYLAGKTDKTLQEIILETYSKFNEDVLRHLFELTSGYLSDPSGSFEAIRTAEYALEFANTIRTSGTVVCKMFQKAIYLGYGLKLEGEIKPLNLSQLSNYIYLLQENMTDLDKKNYLVSGSDLEVYFLTKVLLYAGAQTITIIQKNETESTKQFEQIKNLFNEIELTRIHPATSKSLFYRLSKADAAIVDSSELNIFDERIHDEVSIIRQTKKVQYIVDTSEESLENVESSDLDLRYIDGTIPVSYNEEEQDAAFVAFDEELNQRIDAFMEYLQGLQNNKTKEMTY